jgi:invasion protein IalB
MKKLNTQLLLAIAIVAVTVAFLYATGREAPAPRRVHAQETATPAPSPTPVNQKWQVFHGGIEELEIRLHELNKQQVFVYENSIHISQDGKQFVLLVSDSSGEDCDDCGR